MYSRVLKISLFIALSAAVFFTAASCAKDPEKTDPIENEGGNGSPEYGEYSFTLVRDFPSGVSDASVWSADDRINLFRRQSGGAPLSLSCSEDGTFTEKEPTEDSSYCAVWPAGISSSLSGDVLKVILPSLQRIESGLLAAENFPAIACWEGRPSVPDEMVPVLGLLCFDIVSNDGKPDVGSVLVKTSDGTAVSGEGEIGIGTGAGLVMKNGKDNISLSMDSIGEDTVSCAVALPPGEYGNLSIVVSGENMDGHEIACLENLTIHPGESFYAGRFLIDRSEHLDSQGRANCYIVSGPGFYSFDIAFKGSGTEPVGAACDVAVLWDENTGTVTDLKIEGQRLYFRYGGMVGNALVAVLDDRGEILWSWHIWGVGTDTVSDEKYVNECGAGFYVMDRFLGSHGKESSLCTMYQWGRKDPFSGCDAVYSNGKEVDCSLRWPNFVESNGETGSHRFADRNPDVFIYTYETASDWLAVPDDGAWGDSQGYLDEYRFYGGWSGEKTVNDPCPPGYRVANSYTWTGFTSGKDEVSSGEANIVSRLPSGGYLFMRSEGDDIGAYWPHSTYRDNTSGLLSGGLCWSSSKVNGESPAPASFLFESNIIIPRYGVFHKVYALPVRCVKFEGVSE